MATREKGVYVGGLVIADVSLFCPPIKKVMAIFRKWVTRHVSVELSINEYPLFA